MFEFHLVNVCREKGKIFLVVLFIQNHVSVCVCVRKRSGNVLFMFVFETFNYNLYPIPCLHDEPKKNPNSIRLNSTSEQSYHTLSINIC